MHTNFMQQAIEIARLGEGRTYTNPLVGAIIVQGGTVIAKGAHMEYGKEHAELAAIAACYYPEQLVNSTLYVTMEPCDHFGKQPPCTEQIIASGIRRVVIGQMDPNPQVTGFGKARLEEAGIEVIVGVLQEQVRELNPFYNFYYHRQRPFITLKQAMTLDGKVGCIGERVAITTSATYAYVQRERAIYQGILIGSETALIDNPMLTSRGLSYHGPVRIILDRRGRTFHRRELNLFKSNDNPVWIFTQQQLHNTMPQHVEVIYQPNWDIESVIQEIGLRGIQSIYVEGGPRIHDAFMASQLWDGIITYLSPTLLGGNALGSMLSNRPSGEAVSLNDVEVQRLGMDIRISGRRA